ncbi:hypothetical protein [Ferruginibacter sp.]
MKKLSCYTLPRTHLLLIFCCCFIFFTASHAQVKEFEGVISYTHLVTAIEKDYDVSSDYGYMGKQSEFYYKAGKYKWLNQNAFIEMDLFRSRDTIEFLKMQPSDTIMYVPNNFSNERVIDYKILPHADTVMGYVCDVLVIKAKGQGGEWTRRLSFSDKFPVDPAFFAHYTYNSTNVIYSLMKALPLKIELLYPNRKITYTATKTDKKAVDDKWFEFSADTKFKKLF